MLIVLVSHSVLKSSNMESSFSFGSWLQYSSRRRMEKGQCSRLCTSVRKWRFHLKCHCVLFFVLFEPVDRNWESWTLMKCDQRHYWCDQAALKVKHSQLARVLSLDKKQSVHARMALALRFKNAATSLAEKRQNTIFFWVCGEFRRSHCWNVSVQKNINISCLWTKLHVPPWILPPVRGSPLQLLKRRPKANKNSRTAGLKNSNAATFRAFFFFLAKPEKCDGQTYCNANC